MYEEEIFDSSSKISDVDVGEWFVLARRESDRDTHHPYQTESFETLPQRRASNPLGGISPYHPPDDQARHHTSYRPLSPKQDQGLQEEAPSVELLRASKPDHV